MVGQEYGSLMNIVLQVEIQYKKNSILLIKVCILSTISTLKSE